EQIKLLQALVASPHDQGFTQRAANALLGESRIVGRHVEVERIATYEANMAGGHPLRGANRAQVQRAARRHLPRHRMHELRTLRLGDEAADTPRPNPGLLLFDSGVQYRALGRLPHLELIAQLLNLPRLTAEIAALMLVAARKPVLTGCPGQRKS